MATICRVRLFWEGVAGTPAVGTFFFLGASEVAQPATDALATWAGANSGSQPTTVTWRTDTTASIIDSTTGNVTSVVSVDESTGAGSSGGGPLPRAVQVLTEWRTGAFQGGREIRGRTNLPYPSASQLGPEGRVSDTCIDRTQDAADALIEEPGNPQIVVWSRVSGLAPIAQLATVWNEFAIIRSRRD